jgi:hypothetical protein
MSRRSTIDPDSLNHDSFLDIVSNMVGIMIILVLLVGMRVKNHSVQAAIQGTAAAQGDVEKEKIREVGLHKEVLGIETEVNRLHREAAMQSARRDLMSVSVAAAQREIEERRRNLGGAERESFDLTRNVAEARQQLDQLTQRRARAEQSEGAPTVVESYPTPISRVVDNNEIHFLISGGRITFVPMNRLVEQFQEDARRKVYKLMESPEVTETIGPEGGFRLRYTLERYNTTSEETHGTGRAGTYVRLRRWVLLPVGDLPGETAAEALREGSQFQGVLSALLPGRHTITLWTYPDSFETFRQIRRDLYLRGFSAAARPLPQGVPISGSPEGSKSAAQ